MEKFTDETLMPFGEHKGTPLAKVPDHWLLWFQDINTDEYEAGLMSGDRLKLMEYIEEYF